MCVICVCEEGLALDREKFNACFGSNSHGAGFAWINKKKLHWKKGFMKLDEAWEAYKDVRDYAHVAHFRLSSAGGISPALTHPFLITKDSLISMSGESKDMKLLFHNGTISGWKDMFFNISLHNGGIPVGEVSDTRVMAMAVAILGEGALDGGKYVIASAKEFLMYGQWIEHEGIHYTNSSYETRTYGNYSHHGRGYRSYAEDDFFIETPKRSMTNAELPLQLRGSGLITRDVEKELKENDEVSLLTNELLTNFYGRC